MHISEYMPELLKVGDDVFVFDGVEEPEVYGNQRPPLDVPDPTDTGTKTSGTSSKTSSTSKTTAKKP